MKLAIFSDPHSDLHKKRGYPNFNYELSSFLENQSIDAILITGDIAGNTEEIIDFFEALNLDVKYKFFVPGNHDLWVNSKSKDGSFFKYYSLLPEICKKYDWLYLPNNPQVIDDIAIVGSIGWYDYSTRNPVWDKTITLDDYKLKSNPQTLAKWMDSVFIRFNGYDDLSIANHFNAELILDFEKIGINLKDKFQFNQLHHPFIDELPQELGIDKSENKIRKIIFGSHIVPFAKFVKYTGNLNWDYFSAFIGNNSLGRILASIPNRYKVTAVFGHTHFPMSKIINGIDAYCVPLGYPSEWLRESENLEQMFINRIKIIEV